MTVTERIGNKLASLEFKLLGDGNFTEEDEKRMNLLSKLYLTLVPPKPLRQILLEHNHLSKELIDRIAPEEKIDG